MSVAATGCSDSEAVPPKVPVPGGGQLNFQMHYTTFGAETTDRTQVGFYVLKTPPKYVKRSVVIGDFALMIPAGAARHREQAYLTFPADAYLYTLYPHSHYRGRHVELKAILPDGTEKMLRDLGRVCGARNVEWRLPR